MSHAAFRYLSRMSATPSKCLFCPALRSALSASDLRSDLNFAMSAFAVRMNLKMGQVIKTNPREPVLN